MIESASGVFAPGREREKEEARSEQEKERLERKVGQLAVEVDCKRPGNPSSEWLTGRLLEVRPV
jgi:hypothetical protein